MTDYKQDQDFAREVFGAILDDVIGWIQKNLNPEEVFEYTELEEWANEDGFVKHVSSD